MMELMAGFGLGDWMWVVVGGNGICIGAYFALLFEGCIGCSAMNQCLDQYFLVSIFLFVLLL